MFVRLTAVSLLIFLLSACGGSESQTEPTPPTAQTPSTNNATQPALEAKPATPRASEVDLSALPSPYAEASYGNGKRQFAKCRSCHLISPDYRNTVGPNLYQLFERNVGEVEGFKYSAALLEADFKWTPELLEEWLENPNDFLPKNRMTFVGVRNPDDRHDLIAYLLIETQASN
jgi:cytochrome c